MKLPNDQQTETPGAGVLSVSFKEAGNDKLDPAGTPINEEDELWEHISEELASDGSPAWRIWR